MTEIEGVLTFHSETGTEGGYWALQDKNFISLIAPDYGIFGDQDVWDQASPERKGKTLRDCEVLKDGIWRPLPDPMHADPDYVKSSLFCGDRGDREADQRLAAKYDFRIIYAEEHWDQKWGKGNWRYEDEDDGAVIAPDGSRWLSGGTPNTEPRRPYGVGQGELTRMTVRWEDESEEKRLSDSLLIERWSYDGLHILASGDRLTIRQKDGAIAWEGEVKLKEHPLFAEHASGLWIHADQEGVEREVWARWFFEQYPATLRR